MLSSFEVEVESCDWDFAWAVVVLWSFCEISVGFLVLAEVHRGLR